MQSTVQAPRMTMPAAAGSCRAPAAQMAQAAVLRPLLLQQLQQRATRCRAVASAQQAKVGKAAGGRDGAAKASGTHAMAAGTRCWARPMGSCCHHPAAAAAVHRCHAGQRRERRRCH